MDASLPLLSGSGAVVLALGIGLGLLLGYFMLPTMRQAKRLRAEVDQLRREHDVYKAGVSEHFLKTADLVGEMTKSYAAVYDHLAGGARRFCDETLADKALPFAAPLALGARSAGTEADAGPGDVVIETKAAVEEPTLPIGATVQASREESDQDPDGGSIGSSSPASAAAPLAAPLSPEEARAALEAARP